MCQVWLIREQFCVKGWSKDHHVSLISWRGSRIKDLLCIFIQSAIVPSRPSLLSLPHTAPQLPLGPPPLADRLCPYSQLPLWKVSTGEYSQYRRASNSKRASYRTTRCHASVRRQAVRGSPCPLHTTKTMRSVANHLVSLATKPGVRLTNACRCMDMSAQKDV